MPSLATPERPARWLPWRSATAGWVVTAFVLLIGVPLFLCMPPWVDVTLYDVAARTILRGGVHYRDVFDTNLPGMPLAMAAVRAAFGWRYEVLRAVDLLVVAASFVLLAGWVRRAGAAGYTVAWLAAAVALWYPFASEFSHVQRDGWMLLPALAAARLRLRRVERGWKPLPPAPSPEGGGGRGEGFFPALLEGLAWGAAVWLKPHVIVPAVAVWAASAVLVARRESGRRVLLDLGGLVAGGLIAGAAGVAWLVASGAWPYFLDVFLNWNPAYMTGVVGGAGDRFVEAFAAFRPWGLLHAVALPLAALALWDSWTFSRRVGLPRWLYTVAESEAVTNARALLAALYLGWFLQAVVLQKGFDYVQVPVMVLAMGVVATHRWALGFAYLVWFSVLAVVLNFTALVPPGRDPPPGVPVLRFEPYPATDPKVLALWPRCWREGSSPALRDRIGWYADVHCGTNWEQLGDAAAFLRTVEPPLGPRELNCWHDSTHPLYLVLDLEPATRYLHYGTAFAIPGKRDVIAAAVRDCPQRYVVADLARMTWDRKLPHVPGAGGDPLRLPRWFPVSQRETFPWNQELVFRSGRYVVYRVNQALGEIDIPVWPALDALGPGEDAGAAWDFWR